VYGSGRYAGRTSKGTRGIKFRQMRDESELGWSDTRRISVVARLSYSMVNVVLNWRLE
jgi:hypothetical protein